jgi:hypothetical protein
MTTYNKNRLSLVSQAIAGPKGWVYTDTGAIADIVEVAGFFANAKDMGMDTGDFVEIRANDGFLTKVVRGAAMLTVQDTGATQGTVGLSVVIGDTS